MLVEYTVEPAEVEAVQRGDGLADVYLRRGVEAFGLALEGGGSQPMWRADEVHVVGRYTQEEAEAAAAALWAEGDPAAAQAALAADLECAMDAIAELGAMVAAMADGEGVVQDG